jgi:hypothetical protein
MLKEQLQRKYDQAKNEEQQAEPVDAMHIAGKIGLGPVGIFLPEEEVF